MNRILKHTRAVLLAVALSGCVASSPPIAPPWPSDDLVACDDGRLPPELCPDE